MRKTGERPRLQVMSGDGRRLGRVGSRVQVVFDKTQCVVGGTAMVMRRWPEDDVVAASRGGRRGREEEASTVVEIDNEEDDVLKELGWILYANLLFL